jgi:hypothetical protein
MAKINPRYISTFRAPTEYERQLEEARRRAAMAEALAQQEYQPMEGTAAPIPAAAPLVKALQGFMTARAGRQAQEAAEAAKRTEGEYAGRIAGRLGGVQMPQAPETLEEYKPRAADFARGVMARQAETDLNEVTPTSQYRYDPNEALQMASTSVGTAALKDRPILAQRLANLLEKPKETEYGTTPQYDDQGRAYVINKAGDVRYLGGIKAPAAAPAAVTLATVVRNGKNVVVDARTGEEIGLAPSTPRDEPLMSIVGPDGKPVLVRRSQAEGQQPFVASASAGSSLSGDSATDRRKYRDNRLSLQNAMDSLTAFARQLQETPKEESITGDKAGRLSSAYKLALGAVRELQNTGVLNPGELPFIEDTLRDPQSLMQLFNPASRETITGQIEQIAGLLNNRALRNDELYGYDRRPLEGADIFRKKQTRSKF